MTLVAANIRKTDRHKPGAANINNMSQLHKEATEIEIPVPWGHIAAKIHGSASEKKVLMVHGILDNAGSFDRLLELLPRQYQYVCIDLPGHGLSSPFSPGASLQFFDYVHSILLVLNALKWETCMYIGHSLGSHIGTYFSMFYPERIEKMIGIDGVAPIPVDDLISVIKQFYTFDSYGKDKEAFYTKDEVMYALQFKRRSILNREAAEALFKRAVTKVNDLYKYNRDPRLKIMIRPIFKIEQHIEVYSKFTIPMLVIAANNSIWTNVISRLLNEVIHVQGKSNVSVVRVKGNHDVHNNNPERVAPYICKFLSNELQSKL